VAEQLTASRSLIIRSSGKVGGSVHYAEIEIEKGGSLHGDLHLI
jgi:cytoskeletal protein CcmA (bactofilin family)